MALNKTLTANASKGRHRFTLSVNEDLTNGNNSIMSFNFIISPLQSGWDWSGWGNSISYQIKIGDNIYNGAIPEYNGNSTIVLKSANNIIIPHNSDGTKTIDIGFSVNDSSGQSYTCGNASASSQMELSVLHTAPLLNDVSFQELNTLLTNSGITGGNYFVPYLSKKKITIDATTFDNATITEYEILSGNKTYSSTTNIINIDYSINELITLYDDFLKRNIVDLRIRLTDSLGGISVVSYPYTYITEYSKPNLIQTASNVKRNGQTTGKANLNLTGTFYNKSIFNTQNNISLSFKYWKSGTTEPTTYYTIPTSAYTVNNNNISITKWNIAKNGTVITDVDKSSAYKFKIKAVDSFNSVSEIELTCSKGEWLMAKFKDRVDFKKITIGGTNIIDSGDGYIKYYDGTMICYGTVNFTKSFSEFWGFRATETLSINYPQEFIENTDAVLSVSKGDNVFILTQANTSAEHSTKNKTQNFRLVHPSGMGDDIQDMRVFFTAIGKWK